MSLALSDAVPIVRPSADPFGLLRLDADTALYRVIAIIDDGDEPRSAATPVRTVCRLADGQLVVAEVSSTEARQIGAPVSFVAACEIATRVLSNDSTPLALRTLAMAYLTALAVAEASRMQRAGEVRP